MKIKFKEYRTRSGVTQKEMAAKLGISLTAYRNKEAGRSKFFIDEAIIFCNALKASPNEIVNLFFLQ